MLLIDERFTHHESVWFVTEEPKWCPELGVYTYERGGRIACYFQAGDVLEEDVSIALNEGGKVVETTYQCLVGGEKVVRYDLITDDEIVSRLKYIKSTTPSSEEEVWENEIPDYYDWVFVDFVLKHRLDLMI